MTNLNELNIHEKILKIADAAGVLQKTKKGYNYRYVPEEEIQAKVTGCMQKYNVMLYPSLVPGTLTIEPYSYTKSKTKKDKDEKGKEIIVDYTVQVNEVIVKAEVMYTWVNADCPTDIIECRWAYIGQMEDASQAFGAGATYGNRYYLMKALQLATTEVDPDDYRSKQKEAEDYESIKEQKELDKAIKTLVEKGSELIGKGINKEQISAVVGEINDNNPNPSSIKSIEVCSDILEAFDKLSVANKKASKTKSEGAVK